MNLQPKCSFIVFSLSFSSFFVSVFMDFSSTFIAKLCLGKYKSILYALKTEGCNNTFQLENFSFYCQH